MAASRTSLVCTGEKIARVNADGTVDPTFDPGQGPEGNSSITSAALTPAGEILVVGNFLVFDGVARDQLALLYGSDPAIPRLMNVSISEDRLRFGVRTMPGKMFHIEVAEALSAALWKSLRTFPGDGTTMQFNEILSSGSRYYRVWVEP